MTSDKLVDDKTRTSSASSPATLSGANVCWFFYLAVVKRAIIALTQPPAGQLLPGKNARKRRERGAPSRKRNLLRARRQDGVLDADRGAKRFQGTFAGVEKTGVAHDAADPLRRADNLRIASGGFQDAENPGVEDGDDLGQPRGDRDFADAEDKLAQDIIDAVPASLRLAGNGGGADARAFPDGGAFDVIPVDELRKDVAQHVGAGGRQQS